MKLRPLDVKLNFLMGCALVIFAVLWARLAYLQLWQTEKYNLASQSNRIRLTTVRAARGEIKDRNGKVLAYNKASFTVSVALVELPKNDQDAVFTKLAKVLSIPVDTIRTAVNQQPLKYQPVQIMTEVPLEVVTKIEEQRADLPGVIIEVEPLRVYPYGDFLSHVLGYVRQTGDEEFIKSMQEKYPQEEYKLGDRFGIAGIERWFEAELHGKDGARQVEVDRRMRPVRELGIKEPVPGDDVVLTIDANLQKVAEQSLVSSMKEIQKNFPNAKAGAVVAINTRTGEVLAMASYPSYDPNRFNNPIPVKEWNAKFSDKLPNPPLVNRALRPYPPGSTFKMVTGTAALESGRWTANSTVFDPGYYQLGPRKFRCWRISGHGSVNLNKALEVSCNTYFFTAGLAAGNQAIAKFAREYGLGQLTGITLPGESAGSVPDAKWKKEVNSAILDKRYEEKKKSINEKYDRLVANASPDEKARLEKQRTRELNNARANYEIDYNWNTKWQTFDTLNMSIGQGANNYTPLQLADYVATIANGGTRYKPMIVKNIIAPNGKVIQQFKPSVAYKLQVSPGTLQSIKKGMGAVAQPGGTASGLFRGVPYTAGAKTGTAQVAGKDNNGVFVAFAPYDNPEIAVACVIEQGGHGGSSAGLVGRDIMNAYFKVKVPTGPVATIEE